MDKQQILKNHVRDAQTFVRMVEVSLAKKDNALALSVLSWAQEELDGIRKALEQSVAADTGKSELSE
jgi:hypothetical protein